jgi:hypothetical protein
MKKRSILPALIIIWILFIAYSLNAEQLTVEFNRRYYQNGRFYSHFHLNGSISYDTIDAIQNGITAKFFITFQLLKSRGIFRQGKNVLGEKVYTYTIHYDVWENSFVITDKKSKEKYHIAGSSGIISEINEMASPLSIKDISVDRKENLLLRAKIKIETLKLYPPFGIFLLFFDPWNYESSWINTDVFTLEKL